MYGLDINFSEDAPWLTKLVDKIPFIDTKEPSKVTLSAEGALLQPGHSKAINLGCDSGGSVYLDDFEGSSNPFSLLAQPGVWSLSSVPRTNLYPESNKDSIYSSVNRAMLNWYRIDQTLLQGERSGRANERSPFVEAITQQEVFPNRSVNQDPLNGFNAFLPTLDLTYRPKVRGPYNFDIPGGQTVAGLKISEGLRGDGSLNRPETRWAGITRGITTTDFEASNVEYIDFWMLDPFLDESKLENNKGKLFFHLGDISEDILRDSRKSYENGLPGTLNPDLRTDKSVWGRVPRTELPLPNSSSADNEDRRLQDVGLDGLDNNGERIAFQAYLQQISSLSPVAQDAIRQDPANDDFAYYDDQKLFAQGTDVLTRYSKFNGVEGNSASNTGQSGVQSSTNLPDAEDANRDNSFEENEAFFEYELPLEPLPGGYLNTSRFGKYYIESLDAPASTTISPGFKRRRWHHFRIPLSQFDGKFGSITDFRSIRFMRMVVKGFSEETTIRMGKLDLIRNQWRRYSQRVAVDGGTASNRLSTASVELNAVNIEENSQRRPFNYVVPSCIPREPFVQSFAAGAFQNEQSLSFKYKKTSAQVKVQPLSNYLIQICVFMNA
ncbi:MAG: cell surface protein SprA [Saprospiraceae bacterium]|nr:cell surface protein SprA [Saprospiraceae bacterium]